jgi:hypothetical protein
MKSTNAFRITQLFPGLLVDCYHVVTGYAGHIFPLPFRMAAISSEVEGGWEYMNNISHPS